MLKDKQQQKDQNQDSEKSDQNQDSEKNDQNQNQNQQSEKNDKDQRSGKNDQNQDSDENNRKKSSGNNDQNKKSEKDEQSQGTDKNEQNQETDKNEQNQETDKNEQSQMSGTDNKNEQSDKDSQKQQPEESKQSQGVETNEQNESNGQKDEKQAESFRSRMLLDQIEDSRKDYQQKKKVWNHDLILEVIMIGKKINLSTKNLISVYLFILFYIPIALSQTKVLLSSGQKSISPGDIISVQIIIEGETDAEIASVENINLFNIEGQSTSSSFKFINGQSSKEKTINYELSLKDIGKKRKFSWACCCRRKWEENKK